MKLKNIYLLLFVLDISTLLAQNAKLIVQSSIVSGSACPNDQKVARDEVRFKPSDGSSIRITPCDATKNNSIRLKTDYSIVSSMEVANTNQNGSTEAPKTFQYQSTSLANEELTLNKTLPFGYTKCDATVTQSGGASFFIPISVPDNVNGLNPKLSINYNSQSGNGILGWGLQIGGLSAITRTSQIYYSDSDNTAINFDDNDRFAIDGQRLVRKDTHVDYYKEKFDKSQSYAIYRTEIETFSDIKLNYSQGNGFVKEFEVINQDGSKAFYGATEDSKYLIENTGAFFSFKINRLEDIYGNAINYKYRLIDNQHVIDKIEYNAKTGTTPFAEIRFKYAYREDKSEKFIGASTNYGTLKENLLLSSIEVLSQNSLIKSYDFVYSYKKDDIYEIEDNISKLEFIYEKNKDGNILNPIKIGWNLPTPATRISNTANGKTTITVPNGLTEEIVKNGIKGDFNGDKLTDYVKLYDTQKFNIYLSKLDGSYESVYTAENLALQVNLDINNWSNYSGNDANQVKTVFYDEVVINQERVNRYVKQINYVNDFLVFDVNNDGRDDLLIKYSKQQGPSFFISNSGGNPNSNNSIYYEDGFKKFDIDGFYNPLTYHSIFFDRISNQYTPYGTSTTMQKADYDGNGREDFIFLTNGKVSFNSPGLDINKDAIILTPNPLIPYQGQVNYYNSDFNNDGKTDLIAIKYDSPSKPNTNDETTQIGTMTTYVYSYDKAIKNFKCLSTPNLDPMDMTKNLGPFMCDLNADGKTDVIGMAPAVKKSIGTTVTYTPVTNGSQSKNIYTYTIKFKNISSSPIKIEPKINIPTQAGNPFTLTGNNTGVFANNQFRWPIVNLLPNQEVIYTAAITLVPNQWSNDVFVLNKANHIFAYTAYHSTGKNFVVDAKTTKYLRENMPYCPDGLDELEQYKKTQKYIFADINGDGLSDIIDIRSTRTQINFEINQGNGNFQFTHQGPTSTMPDFDSFGIEDVNKDGKQDLTYTVGDNKFYYSCDKDVFPRTVKDVTLGNGFKTSLSYGIIREGETHYTKSNRTYTFPVIKSNIPLTVVKSMQTPDGIGGTKTINYSYEGGMAHVQGKGFLAFDKTFFTDVSTKTISETEYDYLPQTFSVYAKKISVKVDGTPVSKTENEPSEYNFPNTKRYRIANGTAMTTNYIKNNKTNISQVFSHDGLLVYKRESVNTLETVPVEQYYSVTNNTYTLIGNKQCLEEINTSSFFIKGNLYTEKIHYEYDNVGKLISQTNKFDTKHALKTSYLERDIFGNPTKIETKATHADFATLPTRFSTFEYDPSGRFVIASTNALNQKSTSVFDYTTGLLQKETGIDGLSIHYKYDDNGFLKEKMLTNGTISYTNIVWDNSKTNSVYKMTKNEAGTPNTSIWCDILGREIFTETEGFDSNKKVTKVEFNTIGQAVKQYEQALNTIDNTKYVTTEYDALGRPTSKKHTNGASIQTTNFRYEGLTTFITDPASRQTESKDYTFDKTEFKKDALGKKITYTYFGNGELQSMAVEGSSTVSFTYENGFKKTTTDPNTGTYTYLYNPFGDLISQTDAKNQTISFTYDIMGRPLTRTNKDGTTSYTYETSGIAINEIKSITTPYNTTSNFDYDSRGRLKTATEIVGARSFATTIDYDTFDRPIHKKSPSGFVQNMVYNAKGYLTNVNDAAGNAIYTLNAIDYADQIAQYTLGNNIQVNYNFNPIFHRLEAITAKKIGTASNLYHYGLEINPLTSNITHRTITHANRNLKEVFDYDELDRLTTITLKVNNIQQGNPQMMAFASNGNITSKYDLGAYTYHTTKIHAVKSIDLNSQGTAMSTLQRQQNLAYTDFQRIQSITEASTPTTNIATEWIYGPDDQRRLMVEKIGSTAIRRTYYIGDYELTENLAADGITTLSTTQRDFVMGPHGAIAVNVTQSEPNAGLSTGLYYIITDHLGSVNMILDAQANIKEEQSFDAWGRRRDPTTWLPYTHTNTPDYQTQSAVGARGYTFHEHLDRHGLINMNARLYDPVLGQMIGPDPILSNIGDSQNFNKYLYANGNPLRFTDPTGEHPVLIAIAIGALIGAASYTISYGIEHKWKFDKWDWGEFGKAILMGAVSGAVSFGIGSAFTSTASQFASKIAMEVARAAAHGASQAYLQVLQVMVFGGNISPEQFAITFLTAGLASGASSALSAIPGKAAAALSQSLLGQMAFGGVVGGLTSAAMGGSFLEGFATGAIVSGLNHGLHALASNKLSSNVGNQDFLDDNEAVAQSTRGRMMGRHLKHLSPHFKRLGKYLNYKIRNRHLSNTKHPKTGVQFDADGFPDFSPNLYKGGKNNVIIKATGNRQLDYDAANNVAGYTSTPKGYTWHHHQDYGRMQLVETNIHQQTGHTGGFSLW